MIELIIGLAASIAVLIAFSLYMIRKNGIISNELRQAEQAFTAISNAQSAIDKQIAKEVSRHEEEENSISDRNYFS